MAFHVQLHSHQLTQVVDAYNLSTLDVYCTVPYRTVRLATRQKSPDSEDGTGSSALVSKESCPPWEPVSQPDRILEDDRDPDGT